MLRAWSSLLPGLLDGSLRDAADTLVDELARFLLPPERHREPSLGRGAAGAALCLGHLGAARGDGALIDGAAALLAEAIEQAGELPAIDLAGGSLGIAWVIEHLQRELAWSEDDPNTTTDEALMDQVARVPWLAPWGYLDGLTGAVVYLVERLPAPPARAVLERAVVHLLEAAHTSKGLGATWWTAPGHLAPALRARHPWGHHDLGMAHGAAGVLAALAHVHAAGVATAEVLGLLRRGGDWLWTKRAGLSFPAFLGPGVDPAPGPPGWVHGALATGAALLLAAEALGEPARIAERTAWLRAAAADGPWQLPDDASLGHGSAGLGQLCLRLFQRTGDAVFAERARQCLAHAVEHTARRRAAWGTPAAGTGLLSGLAGTALALSAATSPREPAWDRVLLLSGPRPGDGAGG